MNRTAQRFFQMAFIAAAAVFLAAVFGSAVARADAPEADQRAPQDWNHGNRHEHELGRPGGHGAPQDWSDEHLLYPNPDTREEAARKGTLAFEQWKENDKDPRFALQVERKTRFVQASGQSPFSGQQLQWADRYRRNPPPAGLAMHRDWSHVLGGANRGVGKAGVFPAKFQFDIHAIPSCANDFVVYTTAASGATGSGVFASQTGNFQGEPIDGQAVTITNGARTLTLSASATLNTGTNFQFGGGPAADATNLANAIVRNKGRVGVTASSAGAVVTVTATTQGSGGNSITLATTMTVFNWAGRNLAGGTGTAGQPTIAAFNRIYSSCARTPAQAVPATFWSYNTGNAAFTETSPVLSLDGKQVAFVQRTGAVASLVLLKWSSGGTVGAPTAPARVAAGLYRACTAPCMTVIAFSGNRNDTDSSPYVDYTNDSLYVGDSRGALHKFTGVFNGTPAEAGRPWPVAVSTGNRLSSPVYDSASNLVFVGSTSGMTTGGQLHAVNATSGALVSSGRLARNSSSGVRDAPIVDSTAQRVYAFVGSDRSGTSAGCSRAPCAAVYQFPTAFTRGSVGTKVQVGRGVASTTLRFLYAGSFDNGYYTSATPASPSGNLYVCGSLASAAARPTLWRIPIAGDVMGSPVAGPSLVGANANCSPVTEFMNGANDYIYASVTAGGNKTGCRGACVYMYNLTGLTWGAAAAAAAGLAAPGGTGGIVIDNLSPTPGASQVYYSTLASPGNAIQASQAALQ